MNSYPPQVVNNMFVSQTSTESGREKLAQFGGNFIRDRLREVSFARNILPPDPVTPADCQVSVRHDSLIKIVYLEPKSRAMTLNFRGQPTARYIRAPRAEVAFYTISSEKFEKVEQELLVYRDLPITKMIEDNSLKDIQEVEDRTFLIHLETAVQARQYEANSGWVAFTAANVNGGAVTSRSVVKGELALTNAAGPSWYVWPLQKPDLVKLWKLMDGSRLRSERFLITEVDYDDLLQWTMEDLGSDKVGETTVDGWKYETLHGRKIVRTIKTDILRPGNIYCFAAPEFLGKSYILNRTKFYIDKVGNLITWWAWEDIGMIIANIAGVVKLELYAGSCTPTVETPGYAAVQPVEEEELGAVNNRADAGLTFPQVHSY